MFRTTLHYNTLQFLCKQIIITGYSFKYSKKDLGPTMLPTLVTEFVTSTTILYLVILYAKFHLISTSNDCAMAYMNIHIINMQNVIKF